MSMYDNLPKNYDEQVQIGGAIDLPFEYMRFWWFNGDPRMESFKTNDPVQYYGGWGANADRYENCGLLHPDFQAATWTNSKGEPINVYSCRYVWAALINYRQKWFKRERHNPNSKMHSVENFLVMVAVRNDDKTFTKLGPAVLSGNSYSGLAIRDTFNQWSGASAPLRNSHAQGAPAWFFYIPVGTLGKQIKLESKSSRDGQHSSNITPCHTDDRLLKNLTPDMLDNMFVGQETAEEMEMLLELSQGWADHWNKRDDNQQEETEVDYDVQQPAQSKPASRSTPPQPDPPDDDWDPPF